VRLWLAAVIDAIVGAPGTVEIGVPDEAELSKPGREEFLARNFT
jgi:hypothetical protein